MNAPRVVEVLGFPGCPNSGPALALARLVVANLGSDAKVRAVEVLDEDEAERLRFLGSPTIRVDGRDVEPGADDRRDFALACRVYGSGGEALGLPPEAWLRTALGS